MLVLTRRLKERIVIDGEIRLTVLGIKGHKVRIGIEAPKSVSVDRLEVHQRKGEFTSSMIAGDDATAAVAELVARL